MKFIIPLALLGALLCLTQARSIQNDVDLVEGDMLLSKEQMEIYNQHKNGRVRRASLKDRYLWPKGIVYYTFGPSLDGAGRNLAKKAMKHWIKKTCLKFIKRTNQAAYLEFVYNGKCQARVGYTGLPKQFISVGSKGDPCSLGSSIHELGHAIGFFHEHTRPDRDNYVRINYDNIRKDTASNFKKDNGFFVDSRGYDYDYASIMHYSRYQGNKKAGLVAIQPLKKKVNIGQRNGLSAGDIIQTNAMYKCDAQGDSHLELEDEDEDELDDESVKPTPNPEGPKPGEIED